MSDIFQRRVNFKPFEYPELYEFTEAIRESYWVHDEFNFSGDVQDFRSNCTVAEKTAIQNTMLAISQIEVSVKTFWGNLYNRLPKPEIAMTGSSFSESEARHADAYSHLLEILGLNEKFEHVEEIPAMRDRIAYLDQYLDGTKAGSDKEYAMSVLLFSIFIEHVSLFSQFLIMLSFDKHTNRFRGIANAVEATSKEEQLHGLFGVKLINIIKDEHPEWFENGFEEEVRTACQKAYKAEHKVLDWIFEDGELEHLPRAIVDEFLKDKFNRSLESVGVEPLFDTDPDILDEVEWFYDLLLLEKDNDFFQKRSTAYTKKTQSFGGDDLF